MATPATQGAPGGRGEGALQIRAPPVLTLQVWELPHHLAAIDTMTMRAVERRPARSSRYSVRPAAPDRVRVKVKVRVRELQ